MSYPIASAMMNSLTPRGWLVLGIAIGLAIAGLWWLSGHIWYIEGEGYCIGTLLECDPAAFTR